MRDSCVLEQLSRGVYRLVEVPLADPDLVTVASRIPDGVICLISALAFHDLTTQIPHEIHVALPRGAEQPRMDYPPVRVYRFSNRAFAEGIETHQIDGVGVMIYSPEKTLADSFKFRNSVGLDVVLERIRLYRRHGRVRVDDLLFYASVCRVAKTMRPYLEALL